MISDKMATAISDQINAELYSAYLYMAMSAYAANKGLAGVANWFSVQTQEELAHAHKFYAYLNSHGAAVTLAAIDKPPADFGSALELFEKGLSHERLVSGRIRDLMDLAIEERDHATQITLQWFVSEQVEEEETAGDMVARFKLAGEEGSALFMLDKELSARVFTPPAAE